ncbi:hypothetical protein [Gordonia insulae]|uniref:DUF3168 domain-containing protein n=1 Tax=Gordonia insulae TaxID=2420509 RepID=A0A3G8JFS1_9ACTN|nr:hypothetical protein [Gordonia insulae]AZG43445.1 hypothetical protein D7316_00009 [Gordonia insulae]
MTAVNPYDVIMAMAQRAHDLGLVCYRPTPDIPAVPDLPLVVFGQLPDPPVRAVSVNLYNVAPEKDDSLQTANPLIYAQWRFREPGDDGGLAVNARTHAFFEAMHSETPGPWPGGVSPLWCLRTVVGETQLDNGAWSKPDSYEIRYNPGE